MVFTNFMDDAISYLRRLSTQVVAVNSQRRDNELKLKCDVAIICFVYSVCVYRIHVWQYYNNIIHMANL